MKANRNQSGAALVTTLILLALVAVITGSAVALSQYLSVETASAVAGIRAFYDAESAMNQTILLLRRDVADYPDRTLGNYDYDSITSDMRWLADGVNREVLVRGAPCPVELRDAMAMPALDGVDPQQQLSDWQRQRWDRSDHGSSAKEEERFYAMLDKFTDYTDSDSSRDLDGMEEEGYRKAGLAALPRNGPMQFREELLWVQDAREFFPPGGSSLDDFLVIAPEGLEKLETRMSFLWSPVELIAQACELSEIEEESLVEARRRWREQGTFPEEYLEAALFTRITAVAEMDESGVYAITVDASEQNAAGRRLEAVLRLDGDQHFLEFYEYVFF